MEKIAILAQRKNDKTNQVEWALLSRSKPHRVLRWFGAKKPSKERVLEEEKRIQFFKHKGELLNIIEKIADELDNKGMIHLADTLTDCMEGFAADQQVILRLSKIANLLDHKGEFELAEKLDAVLPDLLSAENTEKIDIPRKHHLTADAAYRMYRKVKMLYLTGMADEDSLEYSKMNELEKMLKSGFMLPAPQNKQIPKKFNNWWDFYHREEKC